MVVRARSRDIGVIKEELALAFVDDPVAQWLFPNPETRIRDLTSFFSIQLRHGYLPRGVVMSTPDFFSTAMWIESWTNAPSLVDRVAHLQIPLLLRSRFGPARELTRLLASVHPATPHLYLGTIGTAPGSQSEGRASSLMDAFVSDAQQKRVGTYLECSSVDNIAFYEHRGFVIQREVVAPDYGPTLWLMWRPPSAR